MTTANELSEWLKKQGLESIEKQLVGEGFDLESLRFATEDELEAIGIDKLGIRKRLMKALVDDFGPPPDLTNPPRPSVVAQAGLDRMKAGAGKAVEALKAWGEPLGARWRMIAIALAACLVLGLAGWGLVQALKGPRTFGEENPLALKVAEVRSIHHAEQLVERLKTMGLEPEILATDDAKSGGAWFRVIIGQSPDGETLDTLRSELESEHGLSGLETLAFSEWKDRILEDSLEVFKTSEQRLIKTAGAGISDGVSDVIRQYPYSSSYFVDFVSVYSSPETKEELKYYGLAMGRIKTDLPRGIKRRAVLAQTEAYCEAILRDTLYGDQVTVNVFKLKSPASAPELDAGESNALFSDPIKYYAQLVLDTGDYRTERTEPLSVQADELLRGLVVTIEPKPNYVRSYAMLTGPKRRFVYIVQSTKKSLEEIRELLSLVGKSQGLLEYQEFHNSFNVLPKQLLEGDRFTGFKMEKLGWSYAQSKNYEEWAKQSVGRWYTESQFTTPKKGYWGYGTIDFITPQAASANFGLMAEDGRSSLRVYGTTGGRLSEERYSNRTYKAYQFPVEIALASNRLKVWISNGSRTNQGDQRRWAWGWLKEAEMVERLERLQLNVPGGFAASSP